MSLTRFHYKYSLVSSAWFTQRIHHIQSSMTTNIDRYVMAPISVDVFWNDEGGKSNIDGYLMAPISVDVFWDDEGGKCDIDEVRLAMKT